MTSPPSAKLDSFRVTWSQNLLEACVHSFPRLSRWWGGIESRAFRSQLQQTRIDRPIFVAGLARSGSTILLEALAKHPAVATHCYRDFPLIFTPLWSVAIQRYQPRTNAAPAERAHGDGIAVTLDSPEAMEEPIWMSYFPDAHRPGTPHVLDELQSHPQFEQFYRDHIRKILRIRGGTRYVSKGNYNVTRLRYLRKLFPDAKFVIPVRHPRTHIASLLKQQQLFAAGETAHPRALRHMQRVGHYEFGLDRRPIDVGRPAALAEVERAWRSGEEVRGWAHYWAMLYGWLHDELEAHPDLRQATLILRYEDLCDDPAGCLQRMFLHSELPPDATVAEFALGIHPPQYYRPAFTPDEEVVIADVTAAVAQKFGYAASAELPGHPNTEALVSTH